MGPRAPVRLLAEYACLFVGLPLAFRLELLPVHPFVLLWIFATLCLVALLRSRDFDRRKLWNATDLRRQVARALVPFVIAAPVLALGAWFFEPERFLRFPRERPLFWALVMLLYPVLSVYPQGIVYRVFILHRYRAVFRSRVAVLLASAAAFAVLHIVFRNWVAPPFCFAGGLLFAWTYERTGSALVAGVQHAAFGCWLFTVGLGWYFYYGAVATP